MTSSAKKWDEASASDPVRNDFIIPCIAEIFESDRPQAILDIGTGSGYVPRIIDSQLSYNPDWTLVDLSFERIRLCISLTINRPNLNCEQADFLNMPLLASKFDAVLLVFTLLEMQLSSTLSQRINMLLKLGGHVVVTIPDTLQDVLKASQESPSVWQDYINGQCSLPKTDKFTDTMYPFNAHRFDDVVELFIANGFLLIGLERAAFDGKVTYLIKFRKNEEAA